jgi:hypothetical protein
MCSLSFRAQGEYKICCHYHDYGSTSVLEFAVKANFDSAFEILLSIR